MEKWGVKLDRNVPVAEYVKKYDANGDGQLDNLEFMDFYKKMLVVSAAKATSGFGKKYGLAIVLGALTIATINAAIRNNAEDPKKYIQWMPSLLVGPVLGMSTVFVVDKVTGEDVDGENNDYVVENNKTTASPDPSAPTKTLAEAEKKPKRRNWFGRKK